jgi:hypothetical protein
VKAIRPVRRQRGAFGQMRPDLGAVLHVLAHAALRGERQPHRGAERDRLLLSGSQDRAA